ncbi:hypothetical protein QR680_015227 [Steinernema hermaphroditum]|uniref:Saposin B-type domain-containing protein n=1 Tax=Steinernema hermaphroditum TaxID=289476 RepID=A0AA39IBL4_9BILA|nr:hypothetical protein QR680_015227 [Steinernema hermaphroditum]
MKLILALAVTFAVASAIAIRKNPVVSDDHHHFLHKVACDACKILDKAILDLEDIAGIALDEYLDGKCNHLVEHELKKWCKNLVNDAVSFVEKFGHRLDEHELCHNLIKVC